MSRQLKKENIYILLILITLMLFPLRISHGKNTVKTDQKIIVIDPGHGGKDTGIVTKAGSAEKDIALMLSESLTALLEKKYLVSLTRSGDDFMENESRTSYANTRKADLFISIHLGNTAENQGRFFFYSPCSSIVPAIPENDLVWQNQALKFLLQSKKICDILVSELSMNQKDTDYFSMGAPVSILSGCQMPAVLIEPFSLKALSGPSSHEEVLTEYARQIMSGIESYLNEKN